MEWDVVLELQRHDIRNESRVCACQLLGVFSGVTVPLVVGVTTAPVLLEAIANSRVTGHHIKGVNVFRLRRPHIVR